VASRSTLAAQVGEEGVLRDVEGLLVVPEQGAGPAMDRGPEPLDADMALLPPRGVTTFNDVLVFD
jgi:hypothetical protein